MPAFDAAVELGYRYLETDVHVTADGVLVAFHDDDLRRTCGMPGRISELPWSKVATARVDGNGPDPAARGAARRLARRPLEHRLQGRRRRGALRRAPCRSTGPSTASAWRRSRTGASAPCGGPRLVRLHQPRPVGARPVVRRSDCRIGHGLAAQVPARRGWFKVVTPRFVRRAHRHGIAVHVWTIDDAAEMNRLLDLGVDGLMTDRPSVLRDVLVARGQWTP